MKIYVGNLHIDIGEKELREYFSIFGEIEEVTITRHQGLSRGFGFVLFENNKDAFRAIEKSDGSLFAGNKIKVHKSY